MRTRPMASDGEEDVEEVEEQVHHEDQLFDLTNVVELQQEDIPPMQNRESLYFPEEEDTSSDPVSWIKVEKCICLKTCSARSWSKANVWSLKGHKTMLS